MTQGKPVLQYEFVIWVQTGTIGTLSWEAIVTEGLETGPRFSFKTGHCNLKKSALFFILFGNTLLLCYCYIFVMKIKNGMSLS